MIMIDAEIKHEARVGGSEPTKVANDSLEMAHKIDWLMVTLFDYVEFVFRVRRRNSLASNSFGEVASISSVLSEEEIDKATDKFLEFLDMFELYLLITFESNYVQFIMFYLCSFMEVYPSFVELFLSTLIRIIKDEEKSTIIRINSAKYLCSFLTRAKFIPFNVLNDTVGFIIEFLEEYISRNKDRQLKRSQSQYIAYEFFHYVVQAMILVLWFRLDSFVEHRSVDHANRFTELSMEIQKYFHSFDYMSAKTLHLFEKFLNKLKPGCTFTNEIHELVASKSLNLSVEAQLEDKFPFDPYFIGHSSKYLVENYIFYESYDADVFLRGYEKTPQSVMNYSETNNDGDGADSSVGYDSYFQEDAKSNADSCSGVSKHGTEASENDTIFANLDKLLDSKKLKTALLEAKRKRPFLIDDDEPEISKKVDTTHRSINILKTVIPH